MRKECGIIIFIVCLVLAGSAGAGSLSQQDAVSRALNWMSGNPVMSQASGVVDSVSTFSGNGTYFLYVVELSPTGYLILNSDDRLPLILSFSADSKINLSEDPQNALRPMLLDYCERMEEKLAAMPLVSMAMVVEAAGEDELHGPFLETSWNQGDPYNLFCPSGTLSGCVPTAFAQLMNYHRWPCYGRGSRSYTDSSGSVTGLHSAVFSDPYDWGNMLPAHSSSDPQVNQDAVAELMAELGVAAGVDYEEDVTSGNPLTLGSRLGEYYYFEPVEWHDSQAELIAPLEADLRAGFPCVVSCPGHAFVADGLMVDSGATTYHFNMGWGGSNNGWYTKDLVPAAGGGSTALDGGITSFRPQLMAFPQTHAVSGVAGSPAKMCWILPKRLESEVSKLTIKRLEQQGGTWATDASEITGVSSGWELNPAGRSGDCWYVEESEYKTGPALMVLNEVFVPDASAHLTFWQYARLYLYSFSIEVSTDNGETYSELYSAYAASADSIEDPSWSYQSVSLAAYEGQDIRLRFVVDGGCGYYPGSLPGVRLDDLAVTSGDWYNWELFATDNTLASDRFSDVTTGWDDCDDFSVFEITSTSTNKDWVVSSTSGVANCFYKQPGGYNNREYHLTSRSTITPSSATRLFLRAKYRFAAERLRVLVSYDRSSFIEIWSGAGTVDWSDIGIDLFAYAGQPIYIRLEYMVDSYYSDGGIWIDSISTQEVTNPELEGQPIYYTILSDLPEGTHTLAAVLTDTNAVEHALGPAFTLTVTAASEDTDSDGLPNDWELLYFGDETVADPTAMASNGVNTLLEAYIAGLDPTNPGSFFEAALANGYVVQWNSVSGRVYSVWSSTNLVDGFQTLETNVSWPQSSWTDMVERAGNFYRVDVELP